MVPTGAPNPFPTIINVSEQPQLFQAPDGDYIAALDSENNLIIFSKSKKFKPAIVTYSKLNLEIFDDEERRLINLLSWTD